MRTAGIVTAWRPSNLARITVIGVGGLVLLWLSVAVTLAMTAGASRPREVLFLWPTATTAKTVWSWNLLADTPTPAKRREVLVLAGAALSREPVAAAAASALGTAAALGNDNVRANAAFAYAERLSRRDVETQLWLIQRAVQNGNIDDALRHYDIALRTDPSIGPLLLPVLARASNGGAVRVWLIAFLRRKPDWRIPYLRAMLDASLAPITVADQLARTGLDPSNPDDATILANGLDQLVRAKQYRLAAAVLPMAIRAPIRNGSFEDPPVMLPFDWWLSTDSDLQAYRDPGRMGDGAYVLRIATDNRGGPVARQLVTLPQGRYALNGVAGDSGKADTGVPSIMVSCADKAEPLAALPLPAATGGMRRFSLTFTVPDRGCDAQWITIDTPAAASVSGWIDQLRIDRTTESKS